MTHSPSDDLKVEIDVIDNKEAKDLGIENHARVLRKMDLHILPFVSLLYLFSFLDRVNIGNAKIAGMATDLKLVGLRYNIAAAIFFVPYCLAQVPANILMKLFRPSRWIPVIMIAWGLIETLTCLVKTYEGLLVARIFLGLAEAGLFPGVTFYISFWYPRAERAKRLALFLSGATIAGAFSGFLASAIEKMEGLGGLHGWQWIFCLEGLATVLVALVAPFFIYDKVETASFLTETEKHYVVEMLKADLQGLATHYDSKFVLQALVDYKIYIYFGIYIGFSVPGYALGLFTPTIINGLGFSVTNSQLLSVLPYVAACICTITVGIYSDKLGLRGPFVIGGSFISLAGYVILYTQTSPGASLTGVVLGAIGLSLAVPVTLAWITTNAGGELKRSVAIAMTNGFGNLGGILSAFIFFDPPRFQVAIGINIGLLALGIPLTLLMMWNYHNINKQKELECRERGITEDQMDEFRDLGDDSPLFRYTI